MLDELVEGTGRVGRAGGRADDAGRAGFGDGTAAAAELLPSEVRAAAAAANASPTQLRLTGGEHAPASAPHQNATVRLAASAPETDCRTCAHR